MCRPRTLPLARSGASLRPSAAFTATPDSSLLLGGSSHLIWSFARFRRGQRLGCGKNGQDTNQSCFSATETAPGGAGGDRLKLDSERFLPLHWAGCPQTSGGDSWLVRGEKGDEVTSQ